MGMNLFAILGKDVLHYELLFSYKLNEVIVFVWLLGLFKSAFGLLYETWSVIKPREKPEFYRMILPLISF